MDNMETGIFESVHIEEELGVRACGISSSGGDFSDFSRLSCPSSVFL